jgi:hypothetical protein
MDAQKFKMITSVYLGSTQLTSSKRFLQSIKNLVFPAISFTSGKRGGFTGQTIRGGNIIAHKFAMEWAIVGTSFSDLATERDNFLALLGEVISAGGKTLKINKSNSVGVQVDVKSISVTGDILPDDGNSGKILIDFESEYPLLSSQVLQSQDINIFTGGGMSIPMSIPLNFSVGGANDVTLVNNGSYQAYPVFTFYGPMQNPSLINLTTNKTLNILYTLSDSNSYIVVDTFLRTALLYPGGLNVRQYVTGDFFTIDKGNNLLHLSAAAYNSQGKVNVSWRDAYLGI